MKTEAIVVGADHTARLQELELPELTATRVRIRTRLSGVSCGTEADATSGRATYMTPPFVSGYQAVGDVVAIGAAVGGLAVGDRVFTTGGGLWALPTLAGGSHARDLVVEAADAVKLAPANPSWPTTAYAALGAIGLEGIARMQLVPGRVLLVFGLGMLGQLAGKLAQQRGLRVVGINRSEWKRDAARALGFDAVCGPVAAEIAAAVAGLGADPAPCAVDLTGSAAIIDLALRQLGRFGELSLLGYYPEPALIDLDVCHGKQLTLHNPVGLGDKLPAVLAAIEAGRLNVEPLIRHTVRPSEITAFYHDLVHHHDRYLGAVIDWS